MIAGIAAGLWESVAPAGLQTQILRRFRAFAFRHMVGHIRYRDYLGKRELTVIVLAFIATALTNYISLHLPIELEPYLALCPVIGLLFGPLGIIGVNAVSFILFVLTRRSSSHLARDIVWMDSLIGYAESKGADTSALRSIRDDASKGRWTANYKKTKKSRAEKFQYDVATSGLSGV